MNSGRGAANMLPDTRQFLSDTAADAIVTAALQRATEIDLRVSVAIVDTAGLLLRFTRRSGAILVSLSMAQDKAHTAVAFGLPTHEWIDLIKDDPQLLYGIPPYPRLVIIGGGYPIRRGGALLGAIGVSGGHYLQDMDVARAGLAALGDTAAAETRE